MKFKKLTVLLLGAMMATSTVLTSCGGSNGAGAAGSSDKKDVVTLKWYAIGQEPQDLATVQAAANEYLAEKIGVNIDMKFVDYGDYDKKMSVLMSTGGDYDLAFTCSWAGDYVGNAKKGAFLELDSYLDNQGKDMKEAIDPRFWDGAKINGKTYAVPNQKEIGAAPMFMFDKELVDKYEIPYEDLGSLESLEPWLKVIKENEPDFVPLYINKGLSFAQGYEQIVEPIGIGLEDDTLKVMNMFEAPEVKSRLETLDRYYKAGYINTDAAVATDDRSIKRFAYKADGQPYAERIWSRDYKREQVATPIGDTWITSSSTIGSMIGVNKNTKNPEKAVEFLNLLNTDEYLRNLINYGVEGTHYDLTDKGQVKVKEPVTYNVSYMSVGNLFITNTLDGDPEDKWEEFEKFNEKAKTATSTGFIFDNANVINEIAALKNTCEEYTGTLYSGSAKDLDKSLEEFNKKLYDQGLQKIIDEAQTQVDAWKASK
ncbi:MAG: ABC transporter substrate-binding protein [Sarcina sp.]